MVLQSLGAGFRSDAKGLTVLLIKRLRFGGVAA